MKAMILAAGRGERMGSLTAEQPKPLLEVGSETLIERHLRHLAAAGVDDVVINLSYRGESIRAFLGAVSKWGQKIAYSEEGEPALETGGGIIHALPLLGARPFILVNADVFTDFDFATLACDKSMGHLVLVANPPHHPEGDFGLDDSGRVIVTPPLLTYSGVALLDPLIFAGRARGRQPLRPILDAAIERRALQGSVHEGIWQDVGTPDRLRETRERYGCA